MRTKLPPDKEREAWRQPPSEAYTAEGYIREVTVHAPPEVVSLEKLEFDDEKRHASFHQRVAELSGPETVHRKAAHPLSLLLRRPADVRQAIVLREVLGPPKALE
jgi:hypothetical protein